MTHGLKPARSPCPGDSPGKKTGMGCHACLQGIFPIQESKSSLMSPASAGGFFTSSATQIPGGHGLPHRSLGHKGKEPGVWRTWRGVGAGDGLGSHQEGLLPTSNVNGKLVYGGGGWGSRARVGNQAGTRGSLQHPKVHRQETSRIHSEPAMRCKENHSIRHRNFPDLSGGGVGVGSWGNVFLQKLCT